MKSLTAAQERLDMRSGCHAAKILPVGVRGTKNVWCLSSLLDSSKTTYTFNTNILYLESTKQITPRAVQSFLSIGPGIVSNEPSQTRAIFAVKRKIEKVEKQKVLSERKNKSQAVVLPRVSPPPKLRTACSHALAVTNIFKKVKYRRLPLTACKCAF